MALRARALGYDGKWALHPGQIDVLNEVFAPTRDEYDKAEAILDAYRQATDVERTGAVMFGDEMIDEASRKMAEGVAARGRAAGMARTAGQAGGEPEADGTEGGSVDASAGGASAGGGSGDGASADGGAEESSSSS